jgi:hypothetical protein
VKILHRLPSIYCDGEALPHDLLGAKIAQIGTIESESEDSLVIEYEPKGQSLKRLIVLFDECRMWIERDPISDLAMSRSANVAKPIPPTPASS